ncbi:DUF636 domain protein [Emericellopsis cladophorae]|uniref:DUF636 domain protein n=1 Tax=Emericellopsis cladophorae TaxID=2686198 RepID=A0A9Q0BBS0_9HYPO|nr:DUF636 domain protein [Emericellopsis cladophorae]KAI6778354.1 DUF636 domain protein [Emericellopsis cladophorae]
MSEGGCLCGAVRYQTAGEPQAKALCHCLDCHKISGSTYSTNMIVPADGFSLTKGKPKLFPKTADSGQTITSFFCGDCGTTLWRETVTYGNTKIVKCGTLDGTRALEHVKPAVELFVKNRPSWVPALVDATQNEAS